MERIENIESIGVKVKGVKRGVNLNEYMKKYKGEEYEKVGKMLEKEYEEVNEEEKEIIIVGGS